ncbi:Uncharacterized protein SCG7109_AL_00240 [Chlamydiales bacterium SCGC AG-110-M15]|nr:Uncharacterized protein SCG7109_AL_00240 [Chlamydiales bacterium SCGC AG-110-M15]
MGRILSSLCIFLLVFTGLYWVWETQPVFRHFVKERLHAGEFLTLEVRYSPEDIVDKYNADLSTGDKRTLLEPILVFHPYAFMEVKFIRKDNGTGEGVVLWGLLDGEMLIDTHKWNKTHGYEDCLIAKASPQDFRIINTLADNGGSLDREGLLNILFVENKILDRWIESCKRKQLVMQRGNDYYLHFENPVLVSTPETYMAHRLVKKAYKHSERVPTVYHISQIETLAQAAFGEGFTVRNAREVYLPVYQLSVENPDGSLLTTQWNAVTGDKIDEDYTGFYP